jgi:formyltetrahydrofolate deformylase
VEYSEVPARVALFVSREDHCLVDLLHRWRIGELRCEIMMIVSNQVDTRASAEFHGVPFHYVPVKTADKAEGERKQLELLEQNHIDLVVLARYMQILPGRFRRADVERMVPLARGALAPGAPHSGVREQDRRICLERDSHR